MSSLRNSYINLTTPLSTSQAFEETIAGKGLKYVAEASVLAIAPLSNYGFEIVTKDEAVLLLGFDIEFNQERVEFSLIESPTSVTGATPLVPAPFNVNRPLDAVPLNTDVNGGTLVVTGGTTIYGPSAGLGVAGQGNKGGAGSLTSSEDFIWLNSNTTYVLQVDNVSAAAVDLVLVLKLAEGNDFPIG